MTVVFFRTPERDLLPMAQALKIGVTAWSPLGGGVLTGKYNQPTPVDGRLSNPEMNFQISERDLKIAETVVKIAQEIGRPASQVALNWIRQQPGNIIPIIGARKFSHIQDNLGCLEFELSPEHLKQLDEVSAIDLGFPHDFLRSPTVQNFAFGGALSKIDRA